MANTNIQEDIVRYSIESWNKTFGGVSSSDIASKLGMDNIKVMEFIEKLEESGRGKLNRNVELYIVSIDPKNPKFVMPRESTTNHVYFPDKKDLEEYFYTSELVRENNPEYQARLYRGAHQLALVYFSEEVLTRYFDHPEYYEVDDSNSGGSIRTKAEAPEGSYLYVRYGKRRQENGQASVTAIYKDLYAMSESEQHYWHSFEIPEFKASELDSDFRNFLARTYEGAYVDFESPIKDVEEAIERINTLFDDSVLFNRSENAYLRVPVENTRKSLCDCCSELYKLVGPDSINQKGLKGFMLGAFEMNVDEFIHRESGRPLRAIQLLTLAEQKIGCGNELTSIIKKIRGLRIEADHKISEGQVSESDFTSEFLALCRELSQATIRFSVNYSECKPAIPGQGSNDAIA